MYDSAWCLSTFALIMAIGLCSSNQMDPHIFPSKGTFFEGWYIRIMDQHAGVSLGFLFSRLQSKNTSGIPLQTNSVILINPNKTSKLSTDISYFPLEEYSITENGRPVTKNPDDRSPPHFEVRIGQNVSFIVKPNGTTFLLSLGDTILRGETDSPIPWGPHGEGPEGWIDKLPLSLHWFVYSLRSNVVFYEVINKPRGLHILGGSEKGRPVLAHIEKNWGASFPKAWIWTQGVDSSTNASFAVSTGLVTEFGIDIPAQMSNYRNPKKGINCKFHTPTSTMTFDHDGCAGKAYIHVTGLFCEAVFEVYTKPEYLSNCLTIPLTTGYALGCVESYNAVANVTVYERHGVEMKYADSHTFTMASLEFGGKYMCHSHCP